MGCQIGKRQYIRHFPFKVLNTVTDLADKMMVRVLVAVKTPLAVLKSRAGYHPTILCQGKGRELIALSRGSFQFGGGLAHPDQDIVGYDFL